MCSIIGSYKKEMVKSLVELNQHRGNFSWSITLGNMTIKNFGEFDFEKLNSMNKEGYLISHIQAPTGGMIEDVDRIHPTEINKTKLWHNGLITPRGIRELQKKTYSDNMFDTKLLHKAIDEFGFEVLSSIEGLFSCLYFDGNDYFIFRTKHGKLYIDNELNLSSERFENSKCINYDTIYKLDFSKKRIENIESFKTKRYNYIIQGELDN